MTLSYYSGVLQTRGATGLPENAAWEEDLVVLLLRGASLDHRALLIVHFHVLPHVVRGRNWTHVVDLWQKNQ